MSLKGGVIKIIRMKTILEQGILSRLIEFARSQEPHLKLSAIWAIKNILYKATTEEKKSIMKQLGWDYLKAYVRKSILI